jgi:plastocyanin
VLAIVVVVLVPTVVFARSFFLTDWSNKYPSSSSDTNASCQLCHGSSTSTWNPYGWAVKQAYDSNGGDIVAAIGTAEAGNSDADPTSSGNLKEITANTQPGWTYGAHNDVYDGSGAVTHNNPVPGGVTGLIDPVTNVAVSDNAFTPSDLSIALGGSVRWSRAAGSTGNHNVTEVGGIFTSGAPTTGTIEYTRTFSAGTFHYWCAIHTTGMQGYVRVKAKTGAAPTGLPFTVTWASATTNTGTLFDVQYKIGAGAWTNWKVDTTSFKGVFGKSGSPVTVVAGTKYTFRVASQSGTATSLWSPSKSFTP